jgi:hypothetical protein
MPEAFNVEEEVLQAEVTEMASDAGAIVQLDATRVQQLLSATGDDAPEFPIIRVEPGLSGNGNNWPEKVLVDIAEQVNRNEPVGYLGHIPPDQRGYAFPDPQTIWLKAVTKREGGKTVLYVKGYNFPGEKIRTLLKTGAVKATSWSGKAKGTVVGGVRQIEEFMLESIDWSRKGAQGMRADLFAVANEMEEGENTVAEVDLSKVTIDQLERDNPSLFTLVEQRYKTQFEEQTQEMKDKLKVADEAETVFEKLRKLFKIEEGTDIIEAMTAIHEKLDNLSSKTIRDKVTELLGDKIKSDKARNTVLRLLPVSEMAGLDDDALKAKVEDALEKDAEIRTIITEMDGGPAPLANRRGGDNGGSGGSRIGQSGGVRESAAVKL